MVTGKLTTHMGKRRVQIAGLYLYLRKDRDK
jgi:hypothetical protein